jgi:hypothetical protein
VLAETDAGSVATAGSDAPLDAPTSLVVGLDAASPALTSDASTEVV